MNTPLRSGIVYSRGSFTRRRPDKREVKLYALGFLFLVALFLGSADSYDFEKLVFTKIMALFLIAVVYIEMKRFRSRADIRSNHNHFGSTIKQAGISTFRFVERCRAMIF